MIASLLIFVYSRTAHVRMYRITVRNRNSPHLPNIFNSGTALALSCPPLNPFRVWGSPMILRYRRLLLASLYWDRPAASITNAKLISRDRSAQSILTRAPFSISRAYGSFVISTPGSWAISRLPSLRHFAQY